MSNAAGTYLIVALLLILFRVSGLINWPWFWVLLPFWILPVFLLVLIAVVAILAIFLSLEKIG